MLCKCSDWQVEETDAVFTNEFIRADVVLRRVISNSSLICFSIFSIKFGESDKHEVDVGDDAGTTHGIAVMYESCKRYVYVIVSRL